MKVTNQSHAKIHHHNHHQHYTEVDSTSNGLNINNGIGEDWSAFAIGFCVVLFFAAFISFVKRLK